MNKQLPHLFQRRPRRKKGNTLQIAAQLAPLEEQKRPNAPEQDDGVATQEYGAIVVGNKTLRLSEDIMEGRTGRTVFGMEPVVIVILVLMLTFIAFIAWQISLMPPQ